MLKKTKFYVGISLLVQSFSFVVMFFALCKKKKDLASVILAIAAAGGAAGAVLLYLDAKDELKRRKITAARDACCGDDGDFFDDFDEYVDLYEESQYDDVSDLCAVDGVSDSIPF